MTIYTVIPTASMQPGQFATSAQALAFHNNPIAIAEGDSTAITNVGGIAFDLNGKTAGRTDETDTSKVWKPDGSGSMEWGRVTSVDAFTYYAVSENAGSGLVQVGDPTGIATFDWNLKTSGGYAEIVSGALFHDFGITNTYSGNAYVGAVAGPSPNPIAVVTLHNAVYTAVGTTLDFSLSISVQTNAGTSPTSAYSEITSSILADNTWRVLLFARDNSGSQQGEVQVKTDGDNVQFRTVLAGVNSYAAFNFVAKIIR